MSAFNFVARLGAASQTTQKILIYAYENTAPSINCSSGTVTVSAWTAIGVDEAGRYPDGSSDTTDRACYCAVATITGLSANSSYSWSASQPGSNKEWEGNFKTLLSVGNNEEFSFITWTCDAYGRGSDALFQYIWDERNNNGGIRFIIKQDDVGYYDNMTIDDSNGLSGHVATGQAEVTPTEYNYALANMAYHRMTDDKGAPGAVRFDLWQNIPSFEMWGDHELADNYMSPPAGTHALTHYEMSKPCWDAFHANGMPSPLSATTFARSEDSPASVTLTSQTLLHFGVECGQLAWTQMDRNSHAVYAAAYMAAQTPALTTAGLMASDASDYTNQQDDLQDYLSGSSAQFKLFASSNSITKTNATVDGHQEAWNDATDTDWQAEFQAFVDWIAANDSVNGTVGNLVYYRGNDHNQQVFTHSLAPTSGSNIDLVELVAGPVTHNGNHTVSNQASGTPYVNGSHETLTDWTNEAEKDVTHHQGVVHWTIYGSTKMRARMVNEFGNVIWEADFSPGSNNFVLPTHEVGASGGGGL